MNAPRDIKLALAQAAAGPPAGDGSPQHEEKVLLIDDDAVARLLTASALTERNWRVIEVDNARDAIAAFIEHQPDVVVLDALMPDVDGFATCERLRRTPGGAHVPVLMLTGLDDETSIARAYEAGATDFFVKSTGQWTLLSQRLRYMLRAARMREELIDSQAKLTKAQRIARLGSWEWDLATHWVRLSDECFSIAGLPRQEAGLADWFVWTRVAEDDRARIEAQYYAALDGGGQLDFDCRLVRPDGQVRVVHVEAEMDRDEQGRVVALHGVLQDISERKQAEERIRQLANYDSLTGLPNRRYFHDQFAAGIERARRTGSSAAVLFVDVDRFKQVNDTLGHEVGDQLLREVAKRLHKTVREHDTVARGTESGGAHGRHSVARLGGDEFTILLTDLSEPQAAERIAQRLLDALRQPFACAGNELFVTASIGVAVYPRDGADVDTLLRKADIAMYAVKDNGRNGWCEFDDKMNTATADRWRTESALHRALERNELVLHYQPKVNVVEGKIVGAEALMRWKRNGELVPPSEFIAVAEESGLIVPITEWAIAEVARQLTTWRDAGIKPVPVSVNISSRHVQRADVAAPVKAALASSGLPPKLFELELTETVLMQNLAAGVPLLQSLKQLGVTISIDDFGTGYSSLAYLKRLPLDVLKIDRSFVRELEISSDSAAIVAAIIAMSKSLKLRVVAEGVETRGQMSRLYQQGCQVMQGFLFARPVPADEFCVLLKGERTNPEWSVASALPARAHAPGSAAPAAPAAARAGSVHAGTPPAVGVATATTPAGGQRSARLRAAHTLARSRN